ncbi:MAG TPA: TIR domain-containing protein [Xanthomonadaceae bacterium]|nr:TIR domain-containing protein [Xanthomonadaceae bacterium]
MADVFVSYSRQDRPRVAPLVRAVEDRGWSVWWDPEIAPGQEFDRLIARQLDAAAAVLVVWTPGSVESRWVRGEARVAAERGVLVPVRFDHAELPIDVRSFHTIDLDDATLAAGSAPVREVLDALGTLVTHEGAAPTPAPTPADARPARPPRDRVPICVLPFVNLSGDPAQDFLCDGITEDIITELSRWRILQVRSRAASFRHRGAAADLAQVARELDVDFVVEGSVRRMGERVRITAQLIDAGTGSHIWAEKFDRAADEPFAVQDQVVRTIVSTLVGRVQVLDTARARRKPPAALAAYECVLKGNALPWDDPEGAAQATRLFEQAIAIDPGYAMAHALLAARRYGDWQLDYSGSDALLDEAWRLARRGVELDNNESTCFSILAQVCLLRHAWALCLQNAQRAVELNPGNQWNLADMGLMLTYLGRAEEALSWFRRAREIDPYFDPPWYYRATGQALMVLRREDEALAMFDQLGTGHFRFSALRAACHARLGHAAEASAHAAACLALKPDFTIARFLRKEPFRDAGDADRLAESLRMAGLPA